MHKIFLVAGAVFAALAVMTGAFGAHALKDMLVRTGRTDVFETAVKYQFYHAFALLFLGLLLYNLKEGLLNAVSLNYAGYCFISGIIIFSGSLYILVLTEVPKWGAVTPFGGLLLIAGWVLAAIGMIRAL